MDNFAKGWFYRYNIQDPPVNGITGLIHALFSGFLAWTGLVSPDHSVLVSNFAGLSATVFFSMLILRHFSRRVALLALACLFAVGGAGYLIISVKQGLETPLHLGIVLCAYYFFLKNNSRLFWMSAALAVISKVDAAPVMGVLGLIHLSRRLPLSRLDRREVRREFRAMALLGALPVAMSLLFQKAIFGRVLPQSAYAKAMFHPHPEGWFPFLAQWLRTDGPRIIVIGAAVILFALFYLRRREWRRGAETLSFAAGVLASLALYYVYNPNEQMAWYYAMPELLMTLQAAILLLEAAELDSGRGHRRIAFWSTTLAVCFACSLPGVLRLSNGWLIMLNGTEPTRIRVGQWLAEHAGPEDRLCTSHGHVARESGLYTYDATGLNSRIVTDLWEQGVDPIGELKPDWVAYEGLLLPDKQRKFGYELERSFYGPTFALLYPGWRIFRKAPEGAESLEITERIPPENVHVGRPAGTKTKPVPGLEAAFNCLRVRAESVVFDLVGFQNAIGLAFGATKETRPFSLEVQALSPSGGIVEVHGIKIRPADAADPANGRAQECVVRFLEPFTTLRIEVRSNPEGEGADFQILDPCVLVLVPPELTVTATVESTGLPSE